MKPVLSTEEVVRLEDIIEREGTSKAELMELAGEFAANEVLKLNPDRVLVLVGFGNNGCSSLDKKKIPLSAMLSYSVS